MKKNFSIEEFEKILENLKEDLSLLETEIEEELKLEENKQNEFKNLKELQNKIEEKIKKNQNYDLKELQIKVNSLKSKINSYGQINLKAINIYNKISEEFNELLSRRKSLTSEKNSILDLIKEIDVKKKRTIFNNFLGIEKEFHTNFFKVN